DKPIRPQRRKGREDRKEKEMISGCYRARSVRRFLFISNFPFPFAFFARFASLRFSRFGHYAPERRAAMMIGITKQRTTRARPARSVRGAGATAGARSVAAATSSTIGIATTAKRSKNPKSATDMTRLRGWGWDAARGCAALPRPTTETA